MIEGLRVNVLKWITRTDLPTVTAGPGQGQRHQQEKIFDCRATCLGLSTNFQEMSYEGNNYCGQYPVMVVLRDDGKFEDYPLSMIEEIRE